MLTVPLNQQNQLRPKESDRLKTALPRRRAEDPSNVMDHLTLCSAVSETAQLAVSMTPFQLPNGSRLLQLDWSRVWTSRYVTSSVIAQGRASGGRSRRRRPHLFLARSWLISEVCSSSSFSSLLVESEFSSSWISIRDVRFSICSERPS